MSTMGSRIKEIREALSLKQDDFANHFQVSRAFISAVEKDKSKFSVDNLVKLLVDYDVNINYVLARRGNMFLECVSNLSNEINSPSSNIQNFRQKYNLKYEIKQVIKEMIISGEFTKSDFI